MNAAAAIKQPLPSRIRVEVPQGKASESKITTALFELQAPAVPQPKKGTAVYIAKHGNVKIPVFRCKDGAFTFAGYVDGKRKSIRRAKLVDAKKSADELAAKLAKGEHEDIRLSDTQRASFLRMKELLANTGIPPELAAAKVKSAFEKLVKAGLDADLDTVVDYYIEHASREKIISISCHDLADRFLLAKENNTFGTRESGENWVATLKSHLKKFKQDFDCAADALRTKDLKEWLEAVPVAFTRKGYRTALSGLVAYGKAHHFIADKAVDFKEIPIPKTGRVKKTILEPFEFARMLHAAIACEDDDKMVPFLFFGGFAGVRHGEMNPKDSKKIALDWKDINEDYIHIGPQTAKNPGEERFIKMPANLKAWVEQYRQTAGPVCAVRNASNSLGRIKRRAKVKAAKGDTRNALRKSWDTYSAALKDRPEDLKALAEEAGHSQNVARRHYQAATYREKSLKWFSILPPDREGILPLDFRVTA